MAAQMWNSGWVDPESCAMVYERHSPLDPDILSAHELAQSRFERGRKYGSLFKAGHPEDNSFMDRGTTTPWFRRPTSSSKPSGRTWKGE